METPSLRLEGSARTAYVFQPGVTCSAHLCARLLEHVLLFAQSCACTHRCTPVGVFGQVYGVLPPRVSILRAYPDGRYDNAVTAKRTRELSAVVIKEQYA